MKNYDSVINEHYRKEAIKHGAASTSTMLDTYIRDKETAAIFSFLKNRLESAGSRHSDNPFVVCDVGCGNGYTLSVLAESFPNVSFFGFDISDDLLSIAKKRLEKYPNVQIQFADIRNDKHICHMNADLIISQRVLINILDENDQKLSLSNIILGLRDSTAKTTSGAVIFIESFFEPLARLNAARLQHGLEQTNPQYHNHYLTENLFNIDKLLRLDMSGISIEENFLSTHYFLGRVIYPLLRDDRAISRNSDVVDFFREAIGKNIGDFSPLKILCFEKK